MGTIIAAESFYGNNWYYAECPKLGCGKKITKISNNDFSCAKCDGHFSTFKYHVMLRLKIEIDGSELKTVSFNACSLKLLKMSSVDFAYFEANAKEELTQAVENLNGHKFNVVIKLKQNLVKNEIQFIIDNVEPIDQTGSIDQAGSNDKVEPMQLRRHTRKRKSQLMS